MPQHLLIYRVDEEQCALPLPVIDRVLPAVEITRVPDAPPTMLGVINIEGRLIPVISMRRKLQRPDRDVQLNDRLIVIRTERCPLALLVDSIQDVYETTGLEVTDAAQVLPGMQTVASLMKLEGMPVLIHDPESFFATELARDAVNG